MKRRKIKQHVSHRPSRRRASRATTCRRGRRWSFRATPSEVVRKISADTNAALAEPAIKDKLAASGYGAEGSSPEELAKLLRAEIAKWSAVIKSVGIKID